MKYEIITRLLKMVGNDMIMVLEKNQCFIGYCWQSNGSLNQQTLDLPFYHWEPLVSPI
jgi:hypothetical protein